MEGVSPVRYFLAANTAAGFHSLYHCLANEENGDTVRYIKGGPGNGKSTLMRRIAAAAEAAGFDVEYILCSGDPSSLDGIRIPGLKTAYVDATSPHVQEPALFGVSGRYLDLTQFYKDNALPERAALAGLFGAYRAQYSRAYDLLSAARKADASGIPGVLPRSEREALYQNGLDRAMDLLPCGEGGSRSGRFLSAFTCRGFMSLPESACAIGRVYLLQGPPERASLWLSGAAEGAGERGQSFIYCPDPLDPERYDALLFPDAGLSFLRFHAGTAYPADKAEYIHLSGDTVNEEYAHSLAVQKELLAMALAALKKAKEYHDELEALYRPALDTDALDRFTREQIEKLFYCSSFFQRD